MFASEGPGLHLAVGPYLHKTVFESSFSDEMDDYNLGLSILGEASSKDVGSIEANIIFFKKSYYSENSDSYKIESLPRVHIGLGYRYWFWEYMSIGFNFSTSYSMGSKDSVKTFGPNSDLIETSASDITEYLLDTSVQVKVWKAKEASYYLDFRYSKLFTSRDNENSNHLGVIFLYKKNLSRRGN